MGKIMIWFDISRTISRGFNTIPTGIDRLEYEYIKKFVQSKIPCNFIYIDGATIYVVNHNFLSGATEKNTIVTKSEFEKNSEAYDSDVYGTYLNVSHHNVSLSNPIYLKNGKREYIYFLHDLIPIQNPEYVRAGDYELHTKRLVVMTSFAKAIICNSHYTKNSLINWCNDNKRSVPKTIVAELATSLPRIQIQSVNINIRKKYFLYVSTLEPRKNHITLIHAWRRLINEVNDVPLLVFVGKRGWNNEDLFRYLDHNKDIKHHVRELGTVSDRFLNELITGAHAILFPSLNEGWGLPVTEAAELGKKVICSNIPALVESSGGEAEYLDPLSVEQWVNAIKNSFFKEPENFKPKINYMWKDHFDKVMDIFN